MSRSEMSVACFNEGCNCSQAVVLSFGEELGLDRATALKITSSFGGGMGRMGEVCGAVTGALILIGLKYSQAKTKDEHYALVQQFAAEFKALHGSLRCAELLGTEIMTPESRGQAAEQFKTLCPVLVRDAVRILENKFTE